MIPHHWKRAAADNGLSDPNADLRPGRFANTLLGAIRGLMATGAAARDDNTGLLAATLGASNTYSVTTNEGLIDLTTGINGVPAAITAPFLLRIAPDTTLAGSATNIPHLKVDGFDCGPIVSRSGAALADSDLVAKVPVLVLGDFAASTDTKVTRVRVLDAVPSDAAAARYKVTTPVASFDLPLPAGGFDAYEILAYDLLLNTDLATLGMRLSNDGGATFRAGSTDYYGQYLNSIGSNVGSVTYQNSLIFLISATQLQVAQPLIFRGVFTPGGNAKKPTLISQYASVVNGNANVITGFANLNAPLAGGANAVRVFASSGLITSGSFIMRGLKAG